ncbi:hypothetical protein CRG98_014123 [Punica granatum]|uniref:Uncharacterized protein n=1 Tax=Punica granatum TaxID=22663 RepID=A0A2I0KAA1_PUNGR|nr:hypothetical protein CRG98_014123 [Punica granatum]
MSTLVGARMHALGSRGLRVSTFLRMRDGHASSNYDVCVRTRISSRRGTHAYATLLGSVYHPEDARRMRVRRSRHYLFTIRRSRAGELPESKGTGYT